MMKHRDLIEARNRHLGQALSLAYADPLKIVRGSMQYLYDETGRCYLDAVNNVCHVGHCHPTVVRAGQEQMAFVKGNSVAGGVLGCRRGGRHPGFGTAFAGIVRPICCHNQFCRPVAESRR